MTGSSQLGLSLWIKNTLVIVAVLVLSAFAGWQISTLGVTAVTPLIMVGAGLLLLYLIMRQPYIGLVMVISLLPVEKLLPAIPYFTSLYPVIGGVTVLAYMIERRRLGLSVLPREWNMAALLGLGFVVWIFIANPDAAIRQGRGIALLTYLQLWMLLILTAELFADKPRRYHVLMWCYIATCLYSAGVAIEESALGEVFDSTAGHGGLAGINTNARQFTIAFMMLFYLRGNLRGMGRWLIVFTWIAQITLLYGVALTGSRTGIIIAVLGVVMLLLSPTSKIKPQRVIIPALVAATIYVAVPDTFWDSLWNSIFPAIEEGSDTVGIRYELWETAARMATDKPFTGVGIDQFARNVRRYSDPLSSTVRVANPHSIYFAVLAETGYPGFLIYMGMVASALFYGLRAAFMLREEQQKNLAYLWVVVLVLLLIGGITKHDQYDKLLWLMFGACASMENFLRRQRRTEEARIRHGYMVRDAA